MIFIQGAAYQTLDPDRDMLDRGFGIFSYTSFPWLQSSLNIGYDLYDESFEGIEYPDRHTLRIIGYARPAKWLNIQPYWVEQKTIDYVRNRSGDGNTLGLDVSLRPGKRLQLGISAEESTLDVQGGRLYTARLLYLSTHYFFTSRLFFRGILQKMELEQNPGLYASEVSGQSEQIGTQFLLSYRVNPFTLVYLGYSDFGMEDDWTDPTTLTRTYFVKLSYAWRP